MAIFFNQSKAIRNRLFAPANKLPFHFFWLGSRLFVTDNPLAIEGLNRGTEILAIDTVPSARIQKTLLPYVRADGGNDAKRKALMDVDGLDQIASFDVYHPLLFPSDRTDFTLDIKDVSGKARRLSVAKIDLEQRQSMRPKGMDTNTPDYWTLTWPKAKTALITMPGWGLYNVTAWDWRARLDAMFEEIASISAEGLIIDIRANEGGLDCGHEIIARLIDTHLSLTQDYERRVRFRTTPSDLNRYLDTWDRSFERLGEGAEDIGGGFYRLGDSEDEVRRISPKGPRFRGKVIVLSGPQNSSATLQFISLMQRHRLGRVYGQPTGGNQRGINGGSFFFVRLPNSGLEADLPLVGFYPKTPKPDAGLLPDVRVDPTFQDLVDGRDRILETALAAV